MSSGVRVVKQGRNETLKSLALGQDEKTERQSEREIASTIKSWIAELELRRRSRRTEALRALK